MNLACLSIWLAWWAAWLLVGCTARRTVYREPLKDRLPHLILLVLGVTLELAPLLSASTPVVGLSDAARLTGLGGMACGLGFASWARLHLGRNWSGLVAVKAGHKIVCSGPYRFLRHPIYTGLIFAAFSSAVAFDSNASVLGASLCLCASMIKAENEERLLARQFPVTYTRFMEQVSTRIIPLVY